MNDRYSFKLTWPAWCDLQAWKCELVDEATGQVTSTIDLSPVTRVNNAILRVPAMTLPHGLYRFTFRIELGSSHLFDVEQSTYVRITKSPIVARIVANGMSEITRGINTLITLSPERYSVDPDLSSTVPQVTCLRASYFHIDSVCGLSSIITKYVRRCFRSRTHYVALDGSACEYSFCYNVLFTWGRR